MNCPYCGEETRQGKLFSGRQAFAWRDDQAKRTFWDCLGWVGGLTAAEVDFWSGNYVPAAFCEKCKKIIIDTGVMK